MAGKPRKLVKLGDKEVLLNETQTKVLSGIFDGKAYKNIAYDYDLAMATVCNEATKIRRMFKVQENNELLATKIKNLEKQVNNYKERMAMIEKLLPLLDPPIQVPLQ